MLGFIYKMFIGLLSAGTQLRFSGSLPPKELTISS